MRCFCKLTHHIFKTFKMSALFSVLSLVVIYEGCHLLASTFPPSGPVPVLRVEYTTFTLWKLWETSIWMAGVCRFRTYAVFVVIYTGMNFSFTFGLTYDLGDQGYKKGIITGYNRIYFLRPDIWYVLAQSKIWRDESGPGPKSTLGWTQNQWLSPSFSLFW